MTQIASKLNVIQYSSPGNHRTNQAERAIQTFKNHFVFVLCSTDPTFPKGAWDKLISQAELTLLLQGSRINPAISAWAQIHGTFDYLSTPIAPAGNRVLAYKSPAQGSSWASYGKPGFYIGPALSLYRCFQVYISKTRRVRTVETLFWHPQAFIMPGASPIEELVTAVRALQLTISSLLTSARVEWVDHQPAFKQTGVELMKALQELHLIFGNDTTTPRADKHQGWQ